MQPVSQLAIDLKRWPVPEHRPVPRYPRPKQKQLWDLLAALQRGEKLRPLEAAHEYGVMALSQRIGELRNLDWPVQSKLIKTPTGKRVSEYWL